MLKLSLNEWHNYKLNTSGLSDLKFGKELKEKEFLLRPDIAFFNHGSFGAVPKRILDLEAEYRREREEHPDLWFRHNAKLYTNQARQVVAEFVGADTENVLLVENVATALNTIVRSYPFKTGEAILDTTLTYGLIALLCTDFTHRIRPDVKRIKLNLKLPIQSEDEILRKYEEILRQNPEIKMVIIDHITSPSSLIMPIKKLVHLCHSYDAIAVIDGAHAIGQLPLDITDFGADFYTSSLHKWCFTPRGCAVLSYDSKHSYWLQPPITSLMLGGSVEDQFFYQSTRDDVPLICARHAVEFYRALGGMAKINSYIKELMDQAGVMLTQDLGLEAVQIPDSMKAPFVRLFKLPPFPKYPFAVENVWKLQRAIFGDSKVFAILRPFEGAYCLRFCVQVYNDLDDVKQLVAVLKDFIKENVSMSFINNEQYVVVHSLEKTEPHQHKQ